MSRSIKSKFAITLLGALAFGASAQAQDLHKNQVVKTDDFQINGTNSVQNSGKLGRVTIGKTKSIDWEEAAKIGGLVFGGVLLVGGW